MSSPTDLATAVQDFVNVIATAITDPYEAVQAFGTLAAFTVKDNVGGDSIVQAQNTLQDGIAAMCRRAAIGALATASAYYQPTSYNDAENLRTNICAIIDAEIEIAGDAGQDNTFLALKQVRSAIVQDLTARGAALAPLTTIQFQEAMPALNVAYRLYQDISRTDQVTAFANPPHPAFLPTTFQVLAS